MFSFGIRFTVLSNKEFRVKFRNLGRFHGVAPSTLCCRNPIHHCEKDDPGRPREWIRIISDTVIDINQEATTLPCPTPAAFQIMYSVTFLFFCFKATLGHSNLH